MTGKVLRQNKIITKSRCRTTSLCLTCCSSAWRPCRISRTRRRPGREKALKTYWQGTVHIETKSIFKFSPQRDWWIKFGKGIYHLDIRFYRGRHIWGDNKALFVYRGLDRNAYRQAVAFVIIYLFFTWYRLCCHWSYVNSHKMCQQRGCESSQFEIFHRTSQQP